MRRRIKILASIFSVFSAFTLVSCLPDPLEVHGIPEVQPEIVVSTQIIPDQSLLVLLTKSFGALDEVNDTLPEAFLEQIVVNDAIVIISGPQSVDTLVALTDGVYGGVFIPFEVNQEYTLRVVSESLGEVTASTVVMPRITFAEVQAGLHVAKSDTLAEIDYTIADPIGRNFYMINVQEVEREDLVENIINPRAFTKLKDDTGFDGQSVREEFRVVTRDYHPGDTIAVTLSNISQPYYDFVKLRLDNRFSLVEFLGEPINYPSNVKGGKGFFNLYIPDIRVFVLE